MTCKIVTVTKNKRFYYNWNYTSINLLLRSSSPSVELVLPGINRPLHHVVYVVVSLSVSVLFHELGHALSAVQEGASIVSVGILCFAVFPGAFGMVPLSK